MRHPINAMHLTAIFAFGGSALAAPLCAQGPIEVIAPIQRVRLHPDEAWVTRVGKARVQSPGTFRYLVTGLPSGLGIQDVRVAAKGPAGTILGDFGVGAETRKVTETQEYKTVKAERDALQDKIDAVEADIEAHAQEAKFLSEFRAAYDKDMSSKLVSGVASGALVVDMSMSISGRLAAVSAKTRKLRRNLAVLNEEKQRMEAEMRKMAAERSASPSRASVEITVPRLGEIELEVTYRTRNAKWGPAYEARLAADEKGLELVLFASVVQTSGEDWGSALLEITNARASRSLAMPKLLGAQVVTWSEVAPRPIPIADRSASYAGAKVAQNTYVQSRSAAGMADLVVPDDAPLLLPSDVQVATISEAVSVEEFKGLATTWILEGLKDVPSDGEPYRFRVLSTKIEPSLAMVAIPRIDPTVYRVARFPIPSGLPLFPGAGIVHFAGTQRIGESPLAMPAAGQPIQLGFGPYRGLRVALSRIGAKKDIVGTFAKEVQWTLQERVELSNDRNEALQVEIHDRELKAGNDKVKISFQPGVQPEPESFAPGVLSWKLRLEPNSTMNLPLTYQIRVPQGPGHIIGLENLRLPD